MSSHEYVIARMRRQAEYCRGLGSPLYGRLVDCAADDFERGGPVAAVLSGREEADFEAPRSPCA